MDTWPGSNSRACGKKGKSNRSRALVWWMEATVNPFVAVADTECLEKQRAEATRCKQGNARVVVFNNRFPEKPAVKLRVASIRKQTRIGKGQWKSRLINRTVYRCSMDDYRWRNNSRVHNRQDCQAHCSR